MLFRSHGLAVGDISVCSPNALIEPIVAPALGLLVAKNEGITPTLSGNDKQVDLIEKGIHVAIRVGKMPNSEYKQRKLGEFRDVLCASPDYLQRHGIDQDALLNQAGKKIKGNYIANSWQGSQISHRFTRRGGEQQVVLNFSANRMCNSLPGVVELARAGCGFAYIPNFIFNDYKKNNELVEVMPDYLAESAPVYAVHAFSGKVPALVRMTIDAVKQQLERVIAV